MYAGLATSSTKNVVKGKLDIISSQILFWVLKYYPGIFEEHLRKPRMNL
jgi:hypothetical protein